MMGVIVGGGRTGTKTGAVVDNATGAVVDNATGIDVGDTLGKSLIETTSNKGSCVCKSREV